MRVPRRSPTPRGGGRDRARPAAGRGAPRPGVHGARSRPPRPDTTEEQARQRALRRTFRNRRVAILALVLCALTISLAFPLKRYIDQRQQVAQLTADVAEGRTRVKALEKDLAQWNDPVFIKRKARERLHFVMPGEIGYIALGEERPTRLSTPTAPGAALAEQPWYDRLWDSVITVDRRPPPGTVPRRPKEHIGPVPTPATASP